MDEDELATDKSEHQQEYNQTGNLNIKGDLNVSIEGEDSRSSDLSDAENDNDANHLGSGFASAAL